jgi:hypothetical protein
MRLKSALDDFETNTLGAVAGLLGRLSYVGRLHDGNRTYEHWGLAKVYGGDAAQRAIDASHRVLLSDVLKEPLALLLEDVAASCLNEHLTEKDFLASLTLPPPKLSRAALAHLRSVLSALSALVESRNNANPLAARGGSETRIRVCLQECRKCIGINALSGAGFEV